MTTVASIRPIVTVMVPSQKVLDGILDTALVRQIVSLADTDGAVVGATRVHFNTQELSMVVPPALFKHTSCLGKVGATITYYKAGVLAGGNINFSRMHSWDAKSWGL